MKISGNYGPSSIRHRTWERLASDLRLNPGWLIAQATRLAERAPDVFASACADATLAKLGSALANRLLGQVVARARTCAAELKA